MILTRRARALLLLSLVPCALLLFGARRRPPQTLYGIFVGPTVVEGSAQSEAFVSTDDPTVDITIRDLVQDVDVYSATVDGTPQTTNANAHMGAGWQRGETLPSLPPGIYDVAIPPSSLPTGHVSSGGANFVAPLIVRPSTPSADVLLLFDSGTWQAYNGFGGGGMYTDPYVVEVGRRRPGFNAATQDMARVAVLLDDLGLSWEAADSDYVEDNPAVLDSYRLVVLMKKWEYMTRPFRETLQTYFDGGGRVLALGVEFSLHQSRRAGDIRTAYKFPSRGIDPVLLDADPSNDNLATYEWARLGEPASRLFGTSYWLGGRAPLPTSWTVHRASHWIWANTGLSESSPLAHVGSGRLIDGTFLTFEGGLPYPDNIIQTETPAEFLVLATVSTIIARPWWCWLAGTPKPQCEQSGWGVIGIWQNPAGGVMLSFPDTYWIEDEKFLVYPEVEQITRNMLQTLGAPGPVDAYSGYSTSP